jgi:hypothetical protein
MVDLLNTKSPFRQSSADGKALNIPAPRRLVLHLGIAQAEGHIKRAAEALQDVHGRVEAVVKNGGTVSAELATELDDAARTFNRAKDNLGFQQGSVRSSIKGLFHSLADRVGIDTSKWGSTKIKGNIATIGEDALKARSSMVSRVISKPFRIAAKNPTVAIVAAGAGLVAWGAGAWSGHQEKRAMAEQEATQMALQQGMMRSPYMNSVTPQEAAMLDARMRDSSNGGASMGDKVMADRAAAQAAGAPVAG